MDTTTAFCFTLSAIEVFIFLSHLVVHVGYKNSRLGFLKKQAIYFALDCSLTALNLYYFWDSYYYFRSLLVFAVIVHIYYVFDLLFLGGNSRIFVWSSVNMTEDRFNLKYLKENIETFIDCSCHGTASFMFLSCVGYKLQLGAILIGLALLWRQVFAAKYFLTEKHMLPGFLRFLAES